MLIFIQHINILSNFAAQIKTFVNFTTIDRFILMRNSLLLTTLLLAIASGDVMAQTVSESEARDKALAFISHGRRAPGHEPLDIELAYTSATETETHYYVFNYGAEAGGFVIVGGDERAEEILGYSENGPFDYDTAPDNFKWWLSQYDVEIHQAIINNVSIAQSNRRVKARGASRADVPELISTKWDQSTPYNNKVPSLGPNYTGDYALATGCVATAMAQVMNKHQWPQQGAGSNSYTGINGLTFAADFGSTTYDWANMIDQYKSGQYTQSQADAVATLMYHCGVSVNMKYGQLVSGGSSASSSHIPYALSTYFGYDKSALCLNRNYYTDEEWFDLVYSELAEGRPLLYGGQDYYGGGGHEFVCHGYRASDQKFAINWGWSGSCDGYFTMLGHDGLKPGDSGSGGAGTQASYTVDQDIIVNVMRDAGGKYGLNITGCYLTEKLENLIPYLMYANTKIETAKVDKNDGDKTFTYTFYPRNTSAVTKTFEYGIVLRDMANGVCYFSDTKGSRTLDVNSYFPNGISCSFSTDLLTYNGIYEVFPSVRETSADEWQILRQPTIFDAPLIEITGGLQPTVQDIHFEISDNSVQVHETLRISHDQLYNGHITYSASPSGIVSIDANGVVTGLKEGTTTITVHGEKTVYFNETSEQFTVTVTPYVKKDVEFALGEDLLTEGKTTSITYSQNYDGTVSFESDNESVATVSATGVVTAISPGVAEITATAEGNDLYNRTVEKFTITVTAAGMVITDYVIANKGYLTPSTVELDVTIKNNTSYHYSSYPFYCTIKIGNDSSNALWQGSIYSGNSVTLNFSFSGLDSFIGKSGTFTILDATNLEALMPQAKNPIPFTICNEITITPTISSANWGTLCLPFDAEVPTGMTAYSVTGVDGNKLMLEKADMLAMDVPYLVSGAGEYSFTGPDTTPWEAGLQDGLLAGNVSPSTDNSPVYAPAGSYVLQQKNGKLGFYLVEKDNTQKIRQYSAYLQIEEAAPALAGQRAFYFDIDAEGIEEIANDESHYGVAYGINGQRVEANHKGLTVRNGKISFIK